MNLRLSLLVTTGLLASPAMATNGYFGDGYGTQPKGLAGAGAALALSSLSTATNPASAAFLGDELELDLAYFNPNRDYQVSGQPSGAPGTFGLNPGQVNSRSRAFLEPSLGANWRPTPRIALNLALYGNGGMNTNYHSPTFGSNPAGVNLVQMFLAPTFAFKVTDHQAFGVTPLLAYQQFKAYGLGAFAGYSAQSADLSDRGTDTATGLGLRVGYQGELGSRLRLGASYQTKTTFSSFKKYRGLFADQGSFDIPSTWTAGAAILAGAGVTFALDLQRINYGEVDSIANPLLPNLQTAALGSNGGAGFGWRNVTVYKFGTQWQATPLWTLRAGYSNGRQPIPASQVLLNILAPAVIEQHFAVGATRRIGTAWDTSLAVTRALSHSVTGPNPLEAPGQQTITLRMDQWEVEAGLVARF
jgi:long-chain fatty acid transport protein